MKNVIPQSGLLSIMPNQAIALFGVLWFVMVLIANVQAATPASTAEQTGQARLILALDEMSEALKQMALEPESGGSACTTDTSRLPEFIGGINSALSDVSSISEGARQQIDDRLNILVKISQILAKVCSGGAGDNEAPSLVKQLRFHSSEIYHIYIEEIGTDDLEYEDKAKPNPPVSYHQWKAEIRSLLDQVNAHTANKDWERLARLGDAIGASTRLPVPDYLWIHITGTDREMLHYNRERLALYGIILKEYADDANLPHVIYFQKKMEGVMAALP